VHTGLECHDITSQTLNKKYDLEVSPGFLPSMLAVPCWEFDACLEMLRAEFGRTDLVDVLDPEAERQLLRTHSKGIRDQGKLPTVNAHVLITGLSDQL